MVKAGEALASSQTTRAALESHGVGDGGKKARRLARRRRRRIYRSSLNRNVGTTSLTESQPASISSRTSLGSGRELSTWSPPPLVKASVVFHGLLAAKWIAHPESRLTTLQWMAANHVLVGLCGMAPRASWLGKTMTRIPVRPDALRPEVALTFDDGPDPNVTPRVLDFLDDHGAKATFFCIGRRVEQHPSLAREIVERGHLIENHTYHHSHTFAFRLYRGLEKEILRGQDAIEHTVGRRPVYLRTPAGMRNFILDPLLHRLGLTLVAWTRRGFDTAIGDPNRILPRLVRGLSGGDILLLHDGNSARQPNGDPVVLDTLPRLLDHLDRRGFAAVPLPTKS